MADKIKSSYKFSKNFYDDAITQGKWWSKLYFKLLLSAKTFFLILNSATL